jgi:membrane fusion protein (multidrug efflux system)
MANFIKIISQVLVVNFILLITSNALGEAQTEDKGIVYKPSEEDNTIRVQVTSDQQMEVVSRMAGQIKTVHFLDGESFKKDDILITFDCRELKAKLKQAQSRVNLNNHKYKSYEELFKLGGASKVELEILKATKEEEQANFELTKIYVEYCTIKAPFSGIVSQVDIKPYQIVSENSPLMFITNNEKLQLEMFIPSNWLNKVLVGTTFLFKVDDIGQNIEAKVERIGGRFDPVTQTVKIYAVVEKISADLRVGMTGTALFDIKD